MLSRLYFTREKPDEQPQTFILSKQIKVYSKLINTLNILLRLKT